MRPFKKAWVLGLVLAALVVFGISVAQTATFTVCASGCDYASIQAAVTAASPGDTITVAAGTYTEQVTVSKSVTLQGAGSSSTTIKAPAVLAADASGMRNIVTVTGVGVVAEIRGFKIDGPGPSGCGSLNVGVMVRGGANANIHDNTISSIRDEPISGCQNGQAIWVGRASIGTTGTATIMNNVINGYQKGGIVVDNTGSNAVITGNTVTGAGPVDFIAQNGIQVSRGATATVTGNTVSGNDYTPGSDIAASILLFKAGNATVVGSNTVSGNEVGLWTSVQATLGTITLTGISGNGRNAVADYDGGFPGDPLNEYPAWSAPTTTFAASGLTGTSDGDGGDVISLGGGLQVIGWNAFTAIQPAVNASASGGTVNVAAGTYTEQVVVNKSITLSGAGPATTIIQVPASPVLETDGDGKSIVEFTGVGTVATMKGFTVRGALGTMTSVIHVHGGANATLQTNTVQGTDALTGTLTGQGITIGDSLDGNVDTPASGVNLITGNTVGGFHRAGIAVVGVGNAATVSGNTVTGNGATGLTTQQGITLQDGATGSITGNTVSGVAYTGVPPQTAVGIFLWDAASGISVTGNTITGSQAGIMVQATAGLTVSGNTVSSPVGSVGIWLLGRGAASTSCNGGNGSTPGLGCAVEATLSGNTLTGAGVGTGLAVSWPIGVTPSFTAAPVSVNISGGTVSGWGRGLSITASGTANAVSITSSSLVGNATAAIENTDTATTANAISNWWGNVSGPGTIANVTTSPWCTSVNCSTLSNNANLTALSLSSGTLSPAFSPSTTAYTASVENSVTSVTASASANPGANVVVTGGSSLSVGSNTVTVAVTSADTTVTKTYTVTVSRAAPIVDVCPNLGDIQADVPMGFDLVNGQCTLKPNAPVSAPIVDVCPNLGGIQADVPMGFDLVNGQCTLKPNALVSAPAVPDKPGAVIVVVQPPTGTGTTPPPVTVTTKWDPGTFAVPVNVTVTPQVPTPVPAGTTPPPPTPVAGGFTVGSMTVQLTVTDASGAKVTSFQSPIVIHVSASQAGDVPAYSQDGVIWVIIPRLNSPELPAGQEDGYYRNSDGSVDIYTRHATLFGLLKDTQVPTVPKLKIRVEKTGLRLSWSNTHDNIKIAGYVVSRNGHGYKASRQPHDVVLPLKAGTYTVRARDTSGNVSKPSAAVKVVRRGNSFAVAKD